MTALAARLSSVSDVDRTEEKLWSFMSDLDSLRSDADVFLGHDVSPEDAAFMLKTGIALDGRPRHADPAVFPRLLVFADEVLDAVDDIRADATRLRRALLSAYREFVIEPGGRRRSRGGDDA